MANTPSTAAGSSASLKKSSRNSISSLVVALRAVSSLLALPLGLCGLCPRRPALRRVERLTGRLDSVAESSAKEKGRELLSASIIELAREDAAVPPAPGELGA